MTNDAPAAASHLLTDALLARLRGQDRAAAQCEELAHHCTGYTPEWCIAGYLLPAAKRYAQAAQPVLMNQALTEASRHAANDPRAQLRIQVGTGVAMAWLGELDQAYTLLTTAERLLAPHAEAHEPGYAAIREYSLRELDFVQRLRSA